MSFVRKRSLWATGAHGLGRSQYITNSAALAKPRGSGLSSVSMKHNRHTDLGLAAEDGPGPARSGTRLEKRHELVSRVLRSNIAQGHFPPGLLLKEATLASLLQTSRAPVQRALQTLERDDLVHRAPAGGVLVGPRDPGLGPIAADLRDLGLLVTEEVDEALQQRGAWEWIAAEVEAAISACLVFGEFRIVEAELAAHHGVSRTMIRDVLGRLQERGLLRKTQTSRWIAGPLTAQTIKDRYALRAILEPAALAAAAGGLDRPRLMTLRDRAQALERAGEATSETAPLFDEFAALCILSTPNPVLSDSIRQNLTPLAAAAAALDALGLPHDEAAVSELRMAIDLLLNGSVDAAAAWWRDHLAARL